MSVRADVLKRARFAALLTAVVATTVGVAAAAPASAASSGGVLKVCSVGNYTSFVRFPARGTVTWPVPAGVCINTKIGFSQNVELIEVWGYAGGREFKLQTAGCGRRAAVSSRPMATAPTTGGREFKRFRSSPAVPEVASSGGGWGFASSGCWRSPDTRPQSRRRRDTPGEAAGPCRHHPDTSR